VTGRLLTAAVALSALAGCGGSDSGPEPVPKTTVAIHESGYRPQKVKIPPHTRVTFVNASPEGNTAQSPYVPEVQYNVRILDRQNKFDTHTLQPGEAQSVEFDTPGRYIYFSSLNPDIVGLVRVEKPR
jgi:plastocyanin